MPVACLQVLCIGAIKLYSFSAIFSTISGSVRFSFEPGTIGNGIKSKPTFPEHSEMPWERQS